MGAQHVPFSINKKPLPPCGRGLTVDFRSTNLACLPAAYRPVIIIRATSRRLRRRLWLARVIIFLFAVTIKLARVYLDMSKLSSGSLGWGVFDETMRR